MLGTIREALGSAEVSYLTSVLSSLYQGLSAWGASYLGLTLEVKPLKLGTCGAQEELKSMGQNTACLF